MGTRDTSINALKLAVVYVSHRAFMANLVAMFPYILSLPLLLKFVDGKVYELMSKTFDAAEVAAFFKYIDVRTSGQGVSFEEAAVKNYLVQSNPNSTSEEKHNAKENLWSKFAPFASLKH